MTQPKHIRATAVISLIAVSTFLWWIRLVPHVRTVDDGGLRNTATRADEWLTYGLNYAESRFSPLDQINASNVRRLGLEWFYVVGAGGGRQEATPLEWNGTLYGITNWSITFAVDARTGKERWRWDPRVNKAQTEAKICCGVVNRGLALYRGRLLVPVIDGRLVALEAETGKPVWHARVAYPQDNYTITMAPRVVKGKVIIGVSGGEYPVRGFFAAYDAYSGAFLWRFYTVPGDPAKGFENEALKRAAETWSGEFWKYGGGGTVWDGIAYDPEADLLYIGTGNGGPWPEKLRGSKGKDNLYVCSILAVKPDTGDLQWYYQVVPGDSWDFDSVQQLTLADLTIHGRHRKVLMQANKNGFFYVLDRISGEFISAEAFSRVTWAKGIDPRTGRPIVNSEAQYDINPVRLSPGQVGAHNWSPMSFNPITGLVYIPASANTSFTFSIDQTFRYQPGRTNIGVDNGAGPQSLREVQWASSATKDSAPPLNAIGPDPSGYSGVLMAWDPIAQQPRWRTRGGGSIGGGALTTASNLVFQVINDGRLVVYTADKGQQLVEIQTGAVGGMGPPITYALGGKQYISFMGGQGAPHTPSPRVYTFTLDGQAKVPTVLPRP